MRQRPSQKTSEAPKGRAGRTEPGPAPAPLSPPVRIAFRFCVSYLTLFCLVTQISGSMLPNLMFSYRGLGRLWPLREVTFWTAQHVFGVLPGADEVTSDGEPFFFWAQTFWVLVVSVIATIVWSALDRRRREYVAMHAWFRLFVRFALAAALFEYGMTKVIPTQFPAPSLATLVTPVGDLALSALLWTSIGASPAYEIFTGCLEVLAGMFLLFPRTTLLGAAMAAGALLQVFALNMTYDIGLKMVSLHLIILAVVLLIPDLRRLTDLFLRNRATQPSTVPAIPRTPQRRQLALALQIAAGVYLLGMYTYINASFWQTGGGGRPKSELYGIWNVEELWIDGELRHVDLNDYDRRWRRIIFDEPGVMRVQRTDDSFARYGASMSAGAVTLTKGASRTWSARFRVDRAAADRLVLDGEMDGHRIRAQLRQVDFETLRLLNSSFRWVRPHKKD